MEGYVDNMLIKLNPFKCLFHQKRKVFGFSSKRQGNQA
jgi:hypothetical protein